MDPRISRTLKLIARRFRQPLTVPQLASAARLSPSRFAHLFQAELGVPPARYLHVVRLTWARTLLETTLLSVREAMERVGFNDPSHFARDFRRHHGVSPRDCRGAALRKPKRREGRRANRSPARNRGRRERVRAPARAESFTVVHRGGTSARAAAGF
jgi:transcriptional regulator GlxA family with amidase domain